MRFGLLGDKLSHSYSPLIHKFVYDSLNISATYDLLECSEEELENYVNMLRDGYFTGFNVTIPYKKTIMSYLDEIDDKALRIGSVNTVYLKNGKVIGTNTDYDGFLGTIKFYNIDVVNKDCYVLGTGGASLAISAVLKDLGGRVFFVSRNPNDKSIGYTDLEEKKIDILVNTTPVGMYPNINDRVVSEEIAKKSNVVMDIIFNPKQTRLLKDANSKINGLYMLVLQAIKAEEIWLNKVIDVDINELMNRL